MKPIYQDWRNPHKGTALPLLEAKPQPKFGQEQDVQDRIDSIIAEAEERTETKGTLSGTAPQSEPSLKRTHSDDHSTADSEQTVSDMSSRPSKSIKLSTQTSIASVDEGLQEENKALRISVLQLSSMVDDLLSICLQTRTVQSRALQELFDEAQKNRPDIGGEFTAPLTNALDNVQKIQNIEEATEKKQAKIYKYLKTYGLDDLMQ